MKKILTLSLCLLAALAISSCTVSESIDNTEASGKSIINEGVSTNTAEKNEITFTELTVADNEECTVKITKINPDSLFGYSLQVNIENKSAETTYTFNTEHCSVNNVECSTLFYEEVAPDKKANGEITISDSTLKDNGITDFTDIELVFTVRDSNDWTADDIVNETIHIYPYGVEKATAFVRESKAADNIIADTEHARITVIGYEEDPIWGYTVNLFIENKSDKNITVSADEASVNGYMADPFFAKAVRAGKNAFADISWSESTFEENGITSVEEIEFLLKVYDSDNWLADKFIEEVITLIP